MFHFECKLIQSIEFQAGVEESHEVLDFESNDNSVLGYRLQRTRDGKSFSSEH